MSPRCSSGSDTPMVDKTSQNGAVLPGSSPISPVHMEGHDLERTAFLRRTCQAFVKRLAAELMLDNQPCILEHAMVLVERYFARRSYARNDRYHVCAAALRLAANAHGVCRPSRLVAIAYMRVKVMNKPNALKALSVGKKIDKTLKSTGLMRTLLYVELDVQITAGSTKWELCPVLKDYIEAVSPEHLTVDQQKQLGDFAHGLVPAIYKTQLMVNYSPSKVAVAVVAYAGRHLGLSLASPSGACLVALQERYKDAFDVSDSQYADIMEQVATQVIISPLKHSASCPEQAQHQEVMHGPGTPPESSPPPSASSPTMLAPMDVCPPTQNTVCRLVPGAGLPPVNLVNTHQQESHTVAPAAPTQSLCTTHSPVSRKRCAEPEGCEQPDSVQSEGAPLPRAHKVARRA